MTSNRRPLLVIVYGTGATSPFALTESASSTCDIAWVVDSDEFDDRAMLRLLRKLGPVADIAGMTEGDAADAVRALQPDGIVPYADGQMATASALAGRLGLDYHDPVVAQRLLDKVTQRRALYDGGLPVPASPAVPGRPTAGAIDVLVQATEFPVVIKPRAGAASRDTHLVRDEAGLRKIIAEESTDDAESAMVAEAYMVGATTAPSAQFSD